MQPVVVDVRNFGTVSVSNVPVQASWTQTTTVTVSTTIAGPIGAGQTVTATVGMVSTFDGGSYSVDARTNLVGDVNAANDVLQSTLTISPGRVPIINNGPRCPGSPAVIMTGMEPGAQYEWFAAQTGGTPLDQGASYTTAPLTAPTEFWVQRVNNLETAGAPNNTGLGGGPLFPGICNNNGAYGLQFNVTAPVTLTSVTVYPAGQGTITVRLLSGLDLLCAGTNVLQTATAVSTGTGPLTIQLDFPLAVRNGYILDAFGTTVDLFRSSAFDAAGGSYPIASSNGSISITGQTFNFTNQYYYWFFDWRLGSEGCDDERTRVPLTIDPAACLADLDVQISGPPTTFRGGTVVIDSTIENLGPDQAQQVQVNSTAPSGIVAQSNTGACTTQFPCALGNLPAGSSPQSITTTWSVPASFTGPSPLTFDVTASATEVDPDVVNSSASLDVIIIDPVDLSVEVTASTVAPGGQPFEYVVTVSNAGPGTALDTVLSLPLDPLFAGATTTGCSNDPFGIPECELGSLAPNTSRSIRIRAVMPPTTLGIATLSGSVTGLSPESDPSNNSASRQVSLELISDFDLQASVTPVPIVPGIDTVVMTIDVTNGGPSAAAGGVVTSSIPPELSGVRTEGCDEDPNGAPVCTISNVLAANTQARVIYRAETRPDLIASTAEARFEVATTSRDEDLSNNTRTLPLRFEPQADLAKAILPPTAEIVAGQSVDFQIRPFNLGPSFARNVQILSTFPPALEGGRSEGCAEDPAGVPVCTLGDLPPDVRQPVFTISASVASSAMGEFTTTFEIRSETSDTLPDNNTTSVTLAVVERTELRPVLTASSESVSSGNEIDLILALEAGPSDARNVMAQFTLPEQLTLESSQGCQNTPTGRTPSCNVGVASGSEVTEVILTVRAEPVFVPVIGEVSVSVETTTNGNDPTDDQAQLSVNIVPPTDVDLRVETLATPERPMPGDDFAFVVTVRNRGPGNADDVTLQLTLPPEVALLSSEGCDVNPPTDSTCVVGSVLANSGTMARFELELAEDAEGDIVLGADIISSTGDEVGPGDESSQTVISLPINTPDAGFVDSGPATVADDGDGGCSCSASQPVSPTGLPYRGALMMLALIAVPWLRSRRR